MLTEDADDYNAFRDSAGLPRVGGHGCALIEIADLTARAAGFDEAWRRWWGREPSAVETRSHWHSDGHDKNVESIRAKAKLRTEQRKAVKESGGDWDEMMKQRRRSMYSDRLAGMTYSAIGTKYDISPTTAQNIIRREERKQIKLAKKMMSVRTVSRPIDMGGQRDVWHEWTPEMQADEFWRNGA